MTEVNYLQGSRPRAERSEQGKEYRITVPRKVHGDWAPAPDRPDPIALLRAQDDGRLPDQAVLLGVLNALYDHRVVLRSVQSLSAGNPIHQS